MILANLQANINSLPKSNENITSALQRIKSLKSYLGLIGDSANLGLGVTPDSTLEQIVIAYNNIVTHSPSSRISVGTGGITFLPGYYKNEFIVSGEIDSSVADELAKLKQDIENALTDSFVTNPSDVLKGASTLKIIEKEDGTLELTPISGTAGSSENPFEAKGSEGTLNPTLTLGIGEKTLSTNIPYYQGGEREVKIEVSEHAGETVAVADALGSGYYANPISIIPVLNLGESTNKAINVEAGKEIIIQQAGSTTLTPSEGFDFIKDGSIKVAPGASKVSAQLSGNTVILTPTATPGWITTTAVEAVAGTSIAELANGSYTITIPTVTASGGSAVVGTTNNKVVVTPGSGYYNGSTAVPLKDSNGNDVSTITGESISIAKDVNSGNNVIVVSPGLATSGITKTLETSTITLGGSITEGLSSETISAKNTKLSTSTGYTEGEEKVLVVKNASAPTFTTIPATEWSGKNEGDKVVINIAESGWIDAGATDITNDFISLANTYVANNLVDTTGGNDVSTEISNGLVTFTYKENLDEVTGGIQIKAAANGKYFTNAKVDLSELITEIDNI